MEVCVCFKVVCKVWDIVDKFICDILGFLVLYVVCDNLISIIVSGVYYYYFDGVFYLMQFIQVVMVMVVVVQVVEMCEQGVFVEGVIVCGYLVGEYIVLVCVIGIY